MRTSISTNVASSILTPKVVFTPDNRKFVRMVLIEQVDESPMGIKVIKFRS